MTVVSWFFNSNARYQRARRTISDPLKTDVKPRLFYSYDEFLNVLTLVKCFHWAIWKVKIQWKISIFAIVYPMKPKILISKNCSIWQEDGHCLVFWDFKFGILQNAIEAAFNDKIKVLIPAFHQRNQKRLAGPWTHVALWKLFWACWRYNMG